MTQREDSGEQRLVETQRVVEMDPMDPVRAEPLRGVCERQQVYNNIFFLN